MNALNRQLMHSVVGIHKDKKLPPFASKTFAAQFESQRKAPQGEPAAKIAFFSTCYVNYNQPEIGTDSFGSHGTQQCRSCVRVRRLLRHAALA
jgi:Fe-S oxidoreductase